MAVDRRPGREEEVAAPPEITSDYEVRQAETNLARAQEMVGEAIRDEETLEDATWHLTLAQWSFGRYDALRRQWPRQMAMVVAATATIFYLVYRLIWTLNLTSPAAALFSAVLWSAECYAGLSLGLYFFQVWRLVEPPLRRPRQGQTVDVFVTTYNEDVSLLRGTLMACREMDYPHTTYVLDDGNRAEVRELARTLGVQYISRTDRTHAKAGNLNNALKQTYGEFIVVLDADHMPYRHFITRLIGHFDDPKVGFVQAPHTTYNLDNFAGRWKRGTRSYWEDIRIFFEAVQLGKNRYGVACFCGSAAVFRRKALEDVGLFATETITEDMHTGMRINARGWKSLAVGEEMVVGLAPHDAATFASQRLRWGEGNLSVLAYDNPLTMQGLTLAGRINYLASIASWTFGPARLILYLTPLVMLLAGIAPVADMSTTYVAIVGCYLATVFVAVKLASNGCGQFLGIETAMMASFHLQIRAMWRAMFRRRSQKFVVTQKGNNALGAGLVLRQMWPQASLVALSIIAVCWAFSRIAFRLSEDYAGLLIGGALASYHTWLAVAVLIRAATKSGQGEQWHHPLCLAADYTVAGEMKTAVSVEFNENGCRLLTWEPLGEEWPIRITFHTPVGDTICHGQVTSSTSLGRVPFAYLNSVVLRHADPAHRDRESDALRGMILHYVVPVVTMAHRIVGEGGLTLREELTGESDFPIPLEIDARQPNLAVQKSVAVLMNRCGFFAALESPCPVGGVARAMLETPSGDVAVDVDVHDVRTVRVAAVLVRQHEFHWRDASAVRRLLSQKRRWQSPFQRTIANLQRRRLSTFRLFVVQAAACVLGVLTVFAFEITHQRDILLAMVGRNPMTAIERAGIEAALERAAMSRKPSADGVLRSYEAAVAIGDHAMAADAARKLADLAPENRFSWMLTYARQLAQTGDRQAAAAAFDRILAEPMERSLPLESQADIYVEAARAALAVRNLDKAVERFLNASSRRAADPDQAEEFLGVLIGAKQTRLAIQILRQLDRSDRVLRRIADVYEMANRPEEAVPELEELYRRHPTDAAVVQRLAELAVVRRDFPAGVNYYKDLHKLEPNNTNATKKLAETLILEGREEVAARHLDRAKKLFDESFRLEPPNDKLKREYAGLLATIGDFGQAVALLEPLSDPASQLQLAAILEMQGRPARALRILQHLKRNHVLGDKAEQSLVRLLLADKQYEEAATRLVGLLHKDPENPQLQRQFLDAVAASDHWEDAVRRAMVDVFGRLRARDFRELDTVGFTRLGDALDRLGMYEEARVALSHGIAKYPEDRRLRFLLAQTLNSLGRYDDAETQYRVLLGASRDR